MRRLAPLLFTLALLAGCRDRSEKPLPDLGTVPEFKLIDDQGRPIALADLRGKTWVADFIFTHCAGPCPRMSKRMSDLQTFIAGAKTATLVSFSVDPTRDTPAVLTEYGKQFGARPDTWRFVTGDEKSVHDLARKGFKLAVEPEQQAAPITHSTMFALVDRDGRIRGYYDGDDAEAYARLKADLQRLMSGKD